MRLCIPEAPPGRIKSNPANTAPGSPWTNPFNTANSTPGSTLTNQSNAPRYSGPGIVCFDRAFDGGCPGTAGTSPYPMQPLPQNNPAQGIPPAGYSPQTTPAQPASMPSTLPGSTLPGGNRYTPPGGSFNYQGTSNPAPNPQPALALAQSRCHAVFCRRAAKPNYYSRDR